MNDRFYMNMNSFKNLVGFKKSEEGQYLFAWEKDVKTIQEAYDFLDVWIEDLDLPIQEKLISCWDQAHCYTDNNEDDDSDNLFHYGYPFY